MINDILTFIRDNYPDSVTCIVGGIFGIALAWRIVWAMLND